MADKNCNFKPEYPKHWRLEKKENDKRGKELGRIRSRQNAHT